MTYFFGKKNLVFHSNAEFPEGKYPSCCLKIPAFPSEFSYTVPLTPMVWTWKSYELITFFIFHQASLRTSGQPFNVEPGTWKLGSQTTARCLHFGLPCYIYIYARACWWMKQNYLQVNWGSLDEPIPGDCNEAIRMCFYTCITICIVIVFCLQLLGNCFLFWFVFTIVFLSCFCNVYATPDRNASYIFI